MRAGREPPGRPGGPARRAGEPAPPEEPPESGVEQAARLARHSRASTWLIVAVLMIAGIAIGARAGIQARKGPLVRPAHALGPNQGEPLGKPSAPVLVEEYGDFQCPACARFQSVVGPTVRQLADRGRIRFVFHEQPILGRESVLAANAATCAGDQGKFWPYHNLLYAGQAPENSGALTADRLVQLGARVGISGTAFSSCVRGGTYEPWLRQVTNQGSVRGVDTTPTFFVDGERVDDIATPQALLQAVAGRS
ncbi:MAG TPA: thioredoxin domain-containing protein [Actinomycetota bacterium]|nr:thioredoxin domain-containing protein [Actinomycetota bacterium]